MALVAKIPKAVSYGHKDRIRSMSKYEKVHIALFFPYMLKHTVGEFASRLRFKKGVRNFGK